VSFLPALLLAAGAAEIGPPPAITVDPCIEVDAEEVRRLTAMELRTWRWRTPPETFEVVAVCRDGIEELRLSNRSRGNVTVRTIDLGAPLGDDRDAKARELALAIAELLRRADMESTPEASPAPSPPVPPPAQARVTAQAVAPDIKPWSIELGVSGVIAGWTGGEMLFGADVTGRAHVARRIIVELRLGGRKSRPVDLVDGSLDGRGVAAAAGLSFDATPNVRQAGVSFGARLGVDWLRYAATDREELPYDGGDAVGVNVTGTTTGFVALSEALCLTVDAAVGGSLHAVVIREDEEAISSMRGVLIAGAVGLAGHF
jgi:hypothetical protein